MKQLLYLAILLPMALLLSFTTNKKQPHFLKQKEQTCWSCSVPTSLTATKSGTNMHLTWSGTAQYFDAGGYYDYIDGNGNKTSQPFHVRTNGLTSADVTLINSSAYFVTYQVTATCIDGSTATSAAYATNL